MRPFRAGAAPVRVPPERADRSESAPAARLEMFPLRVFLVVPFCLRSKKLRIADKSVCAFTDAKGFDTLRQEDRKNLPSQAIRKIQMSDQDRRRASLTRSKVRSKVARKNARYKVACIDAIAPGES